MINMEKKITEGNQKKIPNDKIKLIEQKLFLSEQKDKEKIYLELAPNPYNQTQCERLKQNSDNIKIKAHTARKEKKIKKENNVFKSLRFKINLMIYYFLILSLKYRIISKRNYQLSIISNDIEITVKVNGAGTKKVLSSVFSHPHSILINGVNKTYDSENQIEINNAEKGYPIKIMWHNSILISAKALFYKCDDIIEIDLSKVDTSRISRMDYMFYDCTSLTSVNLNNWDTTIVKNMNHTFYNCIKLESLDISSFNTENIVSFEFMFANCKSLKSLDLSNFRTTSAEVLWSMFENCTELTSIDLSNFVSPIAYDFYHIFYNCVNLEYINIYNFDDHRAFDDTYYDGAFQYIKINAVICLVRSKTPTLYNLASQISCATFSCTSNWKSVQKSISSSTGTCTDFCSTTDNKYEYNGYCYENCPSGTLDINNNKRCYDCNSDCKECKSSLSYCSSCKDSDKFLNDGKCISSCTYGYYTENSIKKCCTLEKCSECTKDSLNEKLCKACYSGYYPKYEDKSKQVFDCYQNLDGYFLIQDNGKSYYKQCYSRCKKCNSEGNDNIHNCIECQSNYNFEIEFNSYKNCYKKCSNYYYLDDDNQIHCINSCPVGYSKLIKAKGECVNNCNKYSNYKKEYQNECYESCPVGTKEIQTNICVQAYEYKNNYYENCPSNTKTDNEDMKCYDACPDSKFEYDSTCLSNCPTGTYRFLKDKKVCVTNLQENYYLDGNDNIYKECHQNCKKCEGGGNDSNNNCKECKTGFIFLFESGKTKNCFECSYYYYIDDSDIYHCTNGKTCPQAHKNIISERKKCINKCINDNSIYKYEYKDKCYEACPDKTKAFHDDMICLPAYKYNNQDYEKCPSNTKTDNEDMKCYDECPEKKFEYESTCLSDCPKDTYRFLKDRRRCITNLQENYYLDNNDNIHKECHENCKKCNGGGDNANNNCDECKSGFMFLSEPDKEKNCFKCSNYYYIDNSGTFTCTNGKTCPQAHKNFISEKNKCINKCKKDSKYKYEYIDKCYETCPTGTIESQDNICIQGYEYNNNYYKVCPSNTKTDNEDMKCYDKCPDEKFEYGSTCVSNCPEGTYRFFKSKRTCITNLQENYYLDENDDIYKECHENCKNCKGEGNNANNNCDECKSGFMFLSEPNKEKNCFKCSFNYYIDDSGNFFCTNDLSCPQDHKNFISVFVVQ